MPLTLEARIDLALAQEKYRDHRYLHPRCTEGKTINEFNSPESPWLEKMHAKKCAMCSRFNRTYKLILRTRGQDAAHDFWDAKSNVT